MVNMLETQQVESDIRTGKRQDSLVKATQGWVRQAGPSQLPASWI